VYLKIREIFINPVLYVFSLRQLRDMAEDQVRDARFFNPDSSSLESESTPHYEMDFNTDDEFALAFVDRNDIAVAGKAKGDLHKNSSNTLAHSIFHIID